VSAFLVVLMSYLALLTVADLLPLYTGPDADAPGDHRTQA
jgi:hypothetical protein